MLSEIHIQLLHYYMQAVTRNKGNADDSISMRQIPGNIISVDEDLRCTSKFHIDLAAALHDYSIRLMKPGDVNLGILPLKLNCAIVNGYSACP